MVRLQLSLVRFLGLRLGTADIKGAFLQSGPITMDVYVHPLREWSSVRVILWKLLKLPYGEFGESYSLEAFEATIWSHRRW